MRRVVSFSLAGLIFGYGASYLITPRYISSAELMFTSLDHSSADLNLFFLNIKNTLLSRLELNHIVQYPALNLYADARLRTPLEDVIDHMTRRDLQILPVTQPGLSSNDTLVFRIDFTYSNPHKAQQTVQAVITRFQELNVLRQRKPLHQQIAETDPVAQLESRVATMEQKLGVPASPESRRLVTGFNLTVLDAPSLPELPVSPNRTIFAASGFVAGLTLAIFTWLFRRRIPARVVQLAA